MINPQNITYLVRTTLTDMGVYSTSMETLIKGTFLIKSDLVNLFDQVNDAHGLMMMRRDDINKICKEYVKFKPILKESIFNSTGIDVGTEEECVIVSELDANVRLMVALLYAFYNNKNEDLPDNDIEDVAIFYRKHYDTSKETTIEEFVDYYKKVFIN